VPATLFFENEDGVAITASMYHQCYGNRERSPIDMRPSWRKEAINKSGSYNKKLKELKGKYGYDNPDSSCQRLTQFVDCADHIATIDILQITNPTSDLAILALKGLLINYTMAALYIERTVMNYSRLILCRLGYPFLNSQTLFYNEEE
jgi:hypothetical protein